MTQGKPRRLPSMQPYIHAEPQIANQPSNPTNQPSVNITPQHHDTQQDPRLMQPGLPYPDPRFNVPELPEPESLPQLGYAGMVEVTAWTTIYPGGIIFSYTTLPGYDPQTAYAANHPDTQGVLNSNVVIDTADLPDNLIQQLIGYWGKVEQLLSDVPHIATANHDATLRMLIYFFGEESPLK